MVRLGKGRTDRESVTGWFSHEPGGPETLRLGTSPKPLVGSGDVLVCVKACGLNFPDILMLEDRYQVRTPRPFAPGSEVAGIVLAVGRDVAGFAPGDRVVGLCDSGGLSEAALISAENLFKLPDSVSFETGASVIFTYGTAYYALHRRAKLHSGERLLVLGAGGGIGLAVTNVARAMGAEVTAAASDQAKLGLAWDRGASHLLTYPREMPPPSRKTFADALEAVAGDQGFDVVADPVGGHYCSPALGATGWGGRYLVIGFAGGIAKPPANLLLLKGCSLVGVDWYQYGRRCPTDRADDVAALFEMMTDGRIAPSPSEVVAFQDAPAALARIANRGVSGKLVVAVGTGERGAVA